MIKNLKNKKKKGFTLIEIIAVVAIIAILAAVLVPKVTGYIKESRKTGVVDEARKVVTAAESYRIKVNQAEATVDALSITELVAAAPDLLAEDDGTTSIIVKIDNGLTVENCKQVLDSENFKFTVDEAGKLTDAPEAL